MSPSVSARRLIGRRTECATLDQLLASLRAGQSRALVMRGEAGVGKSALLEYLAQHASGCGIGSAAGVEIEMELAYAGLQQLCAPFLDRVDRLPGPQRDALASAFGLREGGAPDRFLVGLAVLSLFSDVAEERPLVCIVDDAQWLDVASGHTLAFVARRLGAESVGMVFAVRESDQSRYFEGLPELAVGGLDDHDAHRLLATVITGPLDERVRDRIVAEARGNPLALLELPRGLTPTELAGGFGLPGAGALSGRIEDHFARQLAALPDQTRRLVQLAAADPSGDPSLVWRAAGRLGIPTGAADPALEAGLVDFGGWVRFRHPLARSAAYWSAPIADRRRMHAALAEVTDPIADPDRRAWHRAQAASGPDEEVAAELERSAGGAEARGGMAAAAAFLERAALLTPDPARHAERILAAAQASSQAGAFSKALEVLSMVRATGSESLDELTSARADLLRGRIAFSSADGDAPALLLRAARRLAPLDAALARRTYLEAWIAAYYAGHFGGPGSIYEIARAARSAPPPSAGAARPSDLVLEAVTVLVTEGRARAALPLRRAAQAFAQAGVDVDESPPWLATRLRAFAVPAIMLWDEQAWYAVAARQLQASREAGLLAQLMITANSMAQLLVWRGDFVEAASLIAEAQSIAAATGTRFLPYSALILAGFRGAEAEAAQLIDAVTTDAGTGAQGLGILASHRAAAVLYNGLGRYEAARGEALQAVGQIPELFPSMWALPELIEAASRCGQAALAADALGRLAEATGISQTDWAHGIYARCRALLSGGADAEGSYREAVGRLSRTHLRPELSRAHLLYGEWLRREHRRVDARDQLRVAYTMLSDIGMEAFAERARRELLATGETVRKRSVETLDELTPQEMQVARLAATGRTNPEIGAQLFLSARTVEWHLTKVFGKLGIDSRRDLRLALADVGHQSTISSSHTVLRDEPPATAGDRP